MLHADNGNDDGDDDGNDDDDDDGGVVVVGYCHFIWKESSCCGNLGFSLFTSKLVEMMMMTAGKKIFNVEI